MVPVAHHDLAAWALASEIRDGQEEKDVDVAAQRACLKLGQRLSELVTVEGYRALLVRAVQLAAVDFPFLKGASRRSQSDACLGDIAPSDGVSNGALRDALTAVLAGVISLSITFIGESLTLRAVRDVWPDAPTIRADFGRQEVQQ